MDGKTNNILSDYIETGKISDDDITYLKQYHVCQFLLFLKIATIMVGIKLALVILIEYIFPL